MGAFFKCWRRKLGVATLVMACVFTAAWVRSIGRMELIHVCRGRSLFIIVSRNGTFCIDRKSYRTHAIAETRSSVIDRSSLKQFNVGFSSEKRSNESSIEFWAECSILAASKWCWGFGNFLFGAESHTLGNEHETIFATVPYWSIVIPLALLSAYLLLVKRRPSKPTEST